MITQVFHHAMQRILNHAALHTKAESANPVRLAVAYSGGLDSAALLHLCAAWAKQHDISLSAFHVHHGISPNADAWVLHCQYQCDELAIPFEAAYVQLGQTKQEGVEATARNKRYHALGKLCERHQIDVLLTAHQQDDQAETMLLHLLRGTGLAGLGGMQQIHAAPELLGMTSLVLARPLLECNRSELERYARDHQLEHVEDESNADPRYTRNALRLKIMPLLADYFPAYQTRFARTAKHVSSSLDLIEQITEQDYATCLISATAPVLDVKQLQVLTQSRIDNVLRYWISLHHIPMPSTARLAEIRKQLLDARDDAQVCVKHRDIELHRYRQQLQIAFCLKPLPDVQQFVWNGEASIAFADFAGVLYFDSVQPGQTGLGRDWLMSRPLELRSRQGGERLKLAANRPTRDIKHHYQTLGIPYWQRKRLPFVFSGSELLFAAGVGLNGSVLQEGLNCVHLRWQTD